MGNRVILSASEAYPLAATDFIQVLETSDVPAGVVNILTGPHAEVATHMAGHMDIDAVWSFGAAELSGVIEKASSSNLKRTWVNNGQSRDWDSPQGEGRDFLAAATEVTRNLVASIADMVPRFLVAILVIVLGLIVAKLPERAIKVFAAGAFVLFGLLLIAEGLGLL